MHMGYAPGAHKFVHVAGWQHYGQEGLHAGCHGAEFATCQVSS